MGGWNVYQKAAGHRQQSLLICTHISASPSILWRVQIIRIERTMVKERVLFPCLIQADMHSFFKTSIILFKNDSQGIFVENSTNREQNGSLFLIQIPIG